MTNAGPLGQQGDADGQSEQVSPDGRREHKPETTEGQSNSKQHPPHRTGPAKPIRDQTPLREAQASGTSDQ